MPYLPMGGSTGSVLKVLSAASCHTLSLVLLNDFLCLVCSGGSSSTKNTLLAMDTTSMSTKKDIKKALTKINDDMRIDNTHFDPENLWQRPQAG